MAAQHLTLTYRCLGRSNVCVGHQPASGLHPWEDCDSPPVEGSSKCGRCNAADATFASYLHHAHTRGAGELPEFMVDRLSKPNELYLACFRDGSIKVGTSKAERTSTRLTEQGAWHARIVAKTTNGLTVRHLEDLITDRLKVPQSVSIQRKLRGLTTCQPQEQMLDRLDALADEVHALLSEPLVLGVEDAEITTCNEPWSNPENENPIWNRAVTYPASLRSGSHSLTVQAMFGRIGAITRPGFDDVFVTDLGQLVGYELLIDDVEPDPLVIQSALF